MPISEEDYNTLDAALQRCGLGSIDQLYSAISLGHLGGSNIAQAGPLQASGKEERTPHDRLDQPTPAESSPLFQNPEKDQALMQALGVIRAFLEK